MKVAFTILAHTQPEHLARLVRSLNADWNEIYIHIDASSDIEPFISAVDTEDKPVFLRDNQRIHVNRSGYSTVEAILSLISTALESVDYYDRFCLLSGSDFPVKDPDDIRSMFVTDVEFMRVDRLLDKDSQNTNTKRVSFYHFPDHQGIVGIPASGTIERELYGDIPLYQGAPWWALSYECIGYIVDYLQSHPEYIEFHKNSFCPYEIFFHSIVKSSPYAERLSHDFEKESDLPQYYLSNEHGCHYIDWNSRGVGLPKVLGAEDACKIYHSKALFARKFDYKKSNALIRILEQYKDHFGDRNNIKNSNNFGTQFKSDKVNEKVWIIGDARSGTTWLAELVNSRSQFQFVFEPVHPRRSKEMARIELFTYRSPNQKDHKLERFFQNIFSGKVFTPGSKISEMALICPDKILVKDIFAHLIVKWVLERVNGLKVLVLVRHPFAVALSKRKFAGGAWKEDPVSFLGDRGLYDNYLKPYKSVIRQTNTYFEKQVAIWSIVHSVLFQQLEKDDYLLTFYEDICRQPRKELTCIMNYLGENEDSVENALLNIDKVSKSSSQSGQRKGGRENYSIWREQISEDEYEGGMKILRTFKLDGIYGDGIDPDKSGITDFIKKITVL